MDVAFLPADPLNNGLILGYHSLSNVTSPVAKIIMVCLMLDSQLLWISLILRKVHLYNDYTLFKILILIMRPNSSA